MAQTMVNFRMDEDLKKKMEKVCADMGMSMTTAANVKHFFTLLGKMFFTPYGKEFFTYLSKQIFTS